MEVQQASEGQHDNGSVCMASGMKEEKLTPAQKFERRLFKCRRKLEEEAANLAMVAQTLHYHHNVKKTYEERSQRLWTEKNHNLANTAQKNIDNLVADVDKALTRIEILFESFEPKEE